MNNIYVKNMTQGSEIKHILLFTLPLLAGNLFQQLYNIVDSVIVGRYLGHEALAAVGATGSITFLFYTLCNGLSAGAGILISQSFGAGRHDDVKRYISNSAYTLLAVGAGLTVISVIAAQALLQFLDTPQNILSDSVAYMRTACAGTVAVAAYNWINSVLRALGDSKTPLYFLIIASVLNVGLDLLFVFVFGMGVVGAAAATVISQGVSALGSILFAAKKNEYLRLSREHLRLRKDHIARCLTTGVPIALQNALVSVSMISLQKTANSFGDTVVAAYTATMRVEQLIQQPFNSLGTALSTFSGQNIGAGKPERVVTGYRRSMLITAGFGTLMLAVFALTANYIVGFFVTDALVVEIGGKALLLSACFYVPLGFIHTTRGLLNGAGDVLFAFLNGLAEVIGRIGFAAVLVMIPGVGMWSVWLTTCLTWVLTAVMCLVRYKSGVWRKKCLVDLKPDGEVNA
ncbi:MAG: MATE family efflux transporter [Ruminiclostridium sp.]